MANPTASKPRRSPLDMSIGGYVLTPGAKATIKALAASVARLDSRRRALVGQAGPSPLGLALVAAGVAPPAVLAGGESAPKSRSGTSAASRRPGPRPTQRSPLGAVAREVLDERAQAVSANLAHARARISAGIENGQRWLEERPDIVRENMERFMPGLDDYIDMVSNVDMTDAGMLTAEQVRLREQAKLNRPRPDYNTPYYQEIRQRREALHPLARQIDAGGRTFADTVMFGTPNYVEAVIDTALNPYSYAQNLEGERYIDLLDSEDARAGQVVGRIAGSLVPTPGGGYVKAATSLPAAIGRAALVEGGRGFVHDAIEARGDLEDRFESGVEGALTDAMYAPLGALAERGVDDIAPLAAREYPFLEKVLSTLATTAPKELADAMADAKRPHAGVR